MIEKNKQTVRHPFALLPHSAFGQEAALLWPLQTSSPLGSPYQACEKGNQHELPVHACAAKIVCLTKSLLAAPSSCH